MVLAGSIRVKTTVKRRLCGGRVPMEGADRTFSRNNTGKPGIRKKGQETRQRIIDVGRTILVEEGYEKFILRRVAAKAEIKPGNLQYYFSSKRMA